MGCLYYGGDISDSDCESVGDHDLDNWEDWYDSDLQNRYYGFSPDTEDAQPPLIFSGRVFWGEDMIEPSRVRPDFWDVSVSELQVIACIIDEIVSNKLKHTDSRIGEFSLFPLGFRDPLIGMSTVDGVSWLSAHVTLGYRAMTRSGLVKYYASCVPPARGCGGPFPCKLAGLEGLDQWKGIVWGPGIVDKCCLHMYYGCLGLITLFRDAIMFVHDWAALSTFIRTEIIGWRTITWELGCLGSIHPTCDVARFFCRDVWQIKELEAVVTPGGANDILFLLSACERGTLARGCFQSS